MNAILILYSQSRSFPFTPLFHLPYLPSLKLSTNTRSYSLSSDSAPHNPLLDLFSPLPIQSVRKRQFLFTNATNGGTKLAASTLRKTGSNADTVTFEASDPEGIYRLEARYITASRNIYVTARAAVGCPGTFTATFPRQRTVSGQRVRLKGIGEEEQQRSRAVVPATRRAEEPLADLFVARHRRCHHIASSSLRDLGSNFPPQMICYSWDRTLAWLVADQRDSMHFAPEPLIVIHRIVLDAAIIPDGEGALPPAKAAGELGHDLVLEEVVE